MKLTRFISGFSGAVDRNFDRLVYGRDLMRGGEDDDAEGEALACNKGEISDEGW